MLLCYFYGNRHYNPSQFQITQKTMGICANKTDKNTQEQKKTTHKITNDQSDGPETPPKEAFKYTTLNFKYEIIKQKIDDENEKVKLIRQTKNQKDFVLKYIVGSKQHLKKIRNKIQEYQHLRFAYLSPIHQRQFEQNQLMVRLSFYQNRLDELMNEPYQKSDKLIVLYRIARAIQYLQKNSIKHNKIQFSNIFISSKTSREIHLGLPSWSQSKAKETSNTRVFHIKAFAQIFIGFFPVTQTKDEAIVNLIKEMKNCSNNQINIDTIVKTIFQFNFFDDLKVIDENKKIIIEYQEGDKYEGEVDQNKNKQGYGVMTELQSKYWGTWVNNRRSNRGNWQGKEYCYIGQWKNDERQGFGLQINQKMRQYYEGNYLNGKKTGYGIWQGANGDIYVGDWKDNKKDGFGVYYEGNNQFYYAGRWKQDMKNGRGRQIHINGIYYDGTFKDNLKDGQGHYIHPNKFQYRGEFTNNQITGYGTFQDKEGNQYNGDLINGEYEGRGKYTNKDKTYFYDGQWKNGQRYGQGQEKTKDSVYIGGFIRNVREGKGTLKQLNQKYIGDFKKGRATGNGQYFYQNMDYYKGNFVDKIKEGKGIYVSSADGSTYEGSWHNDKKHGKGKHSLKTGQYYDGQWVESKRQGFGVQYTNDQNRYEGYWKNDKKQGKGIQYQGGNRYEGQFLNGLKHSLFAVLAFANGDRYEGIFVQNRQEGQGKYTWKNRDEYIGGFVANNRQGQGKMIYLQSHVTYEGGWKNDKREGHGVQTYKDGQFVGQFVNNKKHGPGVRTYVDTEGICKLKGTWVNDMRSGEFDFCFPDQTTEKREYFNDRQINLGMTALPL